MKFFLPLIFLLNYALAADCVDCTALQEPFKALENNVSTLNSTLDVNCQDVLKQKAREEYLSHYGRLPKVRGKVQGLTLEGSAEELKFLTKMLKDRPNDAWLNARECKTVLCALTKVYNSEESAYRVLNIAKRDGYAVSASRDFNIDGKYIGQLFSLSEIQKIDLAYKNLPKQYKNLKSLDVIIRLPSGYSSPKAPNAAAYAQKGFHSNYYNRDGEIVFLDNTFEIDGSWGPLVAVHELTHHLDYSKSETLPLGISEEKEFLSLSGWKKTTAYETDEATGKKKQVTKWTHDENKKFITDYSKTEPAEDFAESAAHYMYYPRQLKEVDPEKYNFIKKNVFFGREFLDEPNLNMKPEDIFNICLENQNVLNLYGNVSYSEKSLDKNCLKKFFDDFKYRDPELCSLNTDQIKAYLKEKIKPMMEAANQKIGECNKDIEKNHKDCLTEGDFRKTCSVEKCQLSPVLRKKVKDANLSYAVNDQVMNSVVLKMGKASFLSKALLNGLSDKQKVAESYNLTIQKYFIENATKGLVESYEAAGLKFDSPDEATKSTSRYLSLDPTFNAEIKSFQQSVLSKATKNKDKNFTLIKGWAESRHLDMTVEMEALAELLKKYGSYF